MQAFEHTVLRCALLRRRSRFRETRAKVQCQEFSGLPVRGNGVPSHGLCEAFGCRG